MAKDLIAVFKRTLNIDTVGSWNGKLVEYGSSEKENEYIQYIEDGP